MANSKQARAVKTALESEKNISELAKALSNLESARFREAPPPPVHNTVNRTYPPIEPQIKFKWLAAFAPLLAAILISMVMPIIPILSFVYDLFFALLPLLYPLGVLWIPIYYFAVHKKKRDAEIESIRNSAEYISQCKAADDEFDKMQAEADAAYQSQKQEYDSETLPNYQRELDEWTAGQNAQIEQLKGELDAAKSALEAHYEAEGLFPRQYRKIPVLQYVYDIMSSSDYDIKTAFEMYDRAIQRQIEEERLQAQERAAQAAQEAAYHAQRQAEYAQQQAQSASSGGGYGAAIVGGAIGGKIAKGKQNDGSGRQNLFGTHLCHYGKKDSNGWTGHCDIGCSVLFQCTQRGRYNVGD